LPFRGEHLLVYRDRNLVEPGESLEEVGVEVANVRYFGSQPWPFPNSLMIGFTPDFAGGEVRVEPAEIEDANWYQADDSRWSRQGSASPAP
jgi:NADH pyrophosphatase NudC (nudix superfamily)